MRAPAFERLQAYPTPPSGPGFAPALPAHVTGAAPAEASPPAIVPSAPPEQHLYKEYFVYGADFTGSQALTAGTLNGAPTVQAFSSIIELAIQADAPFELAQLVYVATDPRVYARLTDTSLNRLIHKDTLDLRAVAGQGVTSGQPAGTQAFPELAWWLTPYIVPPSTLLEVAAADFSGGANTVRLTLHGAKLRPGRPPWLFHDDGSPRVIDDEEAYTYPLPSDTNFVAVNGTATFTVTTDLGADFVVEELTGTFQGACTVIITDGGTDRQWMDRALHIQNLVGHGGSPNRLYAPRYIRRGSTIQATVTDLSGSSNLVRLYLRGRKLRDAR